ncbi:MAG: GNAT family protein [Vicinamibacterales bacterium]
MEIVLIARQNQFQQPIGPPVSGWTPRALPPRTALIGRYCRLEPVDVDRHAPDLYQAYSEATDGRDWTYLFVGPFSDFASYRDYLTKASAGSDPLHHAIIDLATGKAVGTAALMRIEPAHGVIEVGHITYSPRLQRTPAATEAMYLLMHRVFDELGYRRYEWKCDDNNLRSRAAAVRYGFTFEGIFRQAIVYKQRSRDTAWFSIIDSEWRQIRSGFERWLATENFDAAGRQKQSLSALIAGARG